LCGELLKMGRIKIVERCGEFHWDENNPNYRIIDTIDSEKALDECEKEDADFLLQHYHHKIAFWYSENGINGNYCEVYTEKISENDTTR